MPSKILIIDDNAAMITVPNGILSEFDKAPPILSEAAAAYRKSGGLA